MDIDRRQFIICDKKIEKENFFCIPLDSGLFLSYHKDLPVKKVSDNLILGHAFPVSSEYPVAENPHCPIEKQIEKWAGRFIVYSHGSIYTDATSSLGIFYLERSGKRIVSSSVHLIVEAYKVPRINKYELDFRGGGDTWDFYPGPYTPYRGIKRLMQYERLNIFGNRFVSPYFVEWNPRYKGMNPSELTSILMEYVRFMLLEVSREYDGIWVPLTGGIDSRCVCAWCKEAAVPFTAYTEERTHETHGAGLSNADREIPCKVSELLDIKWEFCRMKQWDQNKWNSILKHSMGMVRNPNLYSYSYGQYPEGKRKNIILHGSIFEISREYYKKSMGRECVGFDERKNALNKWLWRNLRKSDVHKKSMHAWLKDIEDKGNQEMAWYDRFYFEQRLGSWLSDLNQAMDIIDFDRISPANNYEIISILLAYPQEMRTSGEHQKMIIDTCVSGLSQLPINPVSRRERIMWYYDRAIYKLRGIMCKTSHA